ncbi:MAG TPA: MarR family transcriptional regulator [Galbitalea sp.]|jgi:DNA-binding MarR family transcriptional regulator|nr:MarR family transcriptional regulator [Galbitalea sp.]
MRPSEELRYAILALQREGNRNLIAALKPVGLTPAQAEVLRVLDDYAPLTLTALGELLICESGTGPSRLVDRLVTSGAVQRTVDRNDRRAVTLELTVRGKQLSSAVAQVEEAMYAAIDSAVAEVRVDTVLAVARTLLTGTPAGTALERRRNSGL